MKTKFVRFNKLPKLDSIQEPEGESRDSRVGVTSKDSYGATNSPFKKSDAQRNTQLLEILDSLMKKSIKQVRDFEL